MAPDLSVVICTLNRSRMLGKCIESLTKQQSAPWTFEVLVVDNGSTDATRGVVEAARPGLPALRYIYEERQGLSIARNSGMQCARASWIAYLDDDASAATGWCRAICQTFAMLAAEGKREFACLGGPVEPVFEEARPAWLSKELEEVYTILDRGELLEPFPPSQVPLGANCAFLREVLVNHRFNERLGRAGTSMI
ncbi:MAG: glycosyltransferase family 2 protein, partial [Terriglobia bacterium]